MRKLESLIHFFYTAVFFVLFLSNSQQTKVRDLQQLDLRREELGELI